VPDVHVADIDDALVTSQPLLDATGDLGSVAIDLEDGSCPAVIGAQVQTVLSRGSWPW
jgi:hypothetical protein